MHVRGWHLTIVRMPNMWLGCSEIIGLILYAVEKAKFCLAPCQTLGFRSQASTGVLNAVTCFTIEQIFLSAILQTLHENTGAEGALGKCTEGCREYPVDTAVVRFLNFQIFLRDLLLIGVVLYAWSTCLHVSCTYLTTHHSSSDKAAEGLVGQIKGWKCPCPQDVAGFSFLARHLV